MSAWASGNWHVSDGKADEFMDRWEELAKGSVGVTEGFARARLTRDARDPNHFVSFAEFESTETRDAWFNAPDFQEQLAPCRELCDDFHGSPYDEVRTVN